MASRRFAHTEDLNHYSILAVELVEPAAERHLNVFSYHYQLCIGYIVTAYDGDRVAHTVRIVSVIFLDVLFWCVSRYSADVVCVCDVHAFGR